MNIPGYLSLIAQDDLSTTTSSVRKPSPYAGEFDSSCESRCRRGTVDEPSGHLLFETFCSRLCNENEGVYVHDIVYTKNGQKIAVIGASSGLTCAYYLARTGYEVDVYEKESIAGGVLALAYRNIVAR